MTKKKFIEDQKSNIELATKIWSSKNKKLKDKQNKEKSKQEFLNQRKAKCNKKREKKQIYLEEIKNLLRNFVRITCNVFSYNETF